MDILLPSPKPSWDIIRVWELSSIEDMFIDVEEDEGGGEVVVRSDATSKTPIAIKDSIFIVLLNFPNIFIFFDSVCSSVFCSCFVFRFFYDFSSQ